MYLNFNIRQFLKAQPRQHISNIYIYIYASDRARQNECFKLVINVGSVVQNGVGTNAVI